MGFKKKKKDVSSTSNLSEVAIRNNIRISNPYGYYPEDVDRVIIKLEELIKNLENENKRFEQLYNDTLKEKKAADSELTRLKLDMSLMNVPDTSAEEDIAMISRLSNINEDVGTIEHEIPTMAENTESRIPLDVIENSNNVGDIMFDDLVTPEYSKENKKSSEQVNENATGIYNEYGQLDIL